MKHVWTAIQIMSYTVAATVLALDIFVWRHF